MQDWKGEIKIISKKTLQEKNMPSTIDIPNIASVEAAYRLNLSYDEFMNYVRVGKICYTLKGCEMFYTGRELNRFKTEVLDGDKKK